jgi:hypothetical protein
MSQISILKRSIRTAITGLLFVGLLSPANATHQQDLLKVFPDLPANAPVVHATTEPTSHLPWLAPVGHRQPHQTDVPQDEAVSPWERQQLEHDQELDRKLMICRGC